MSKKSFKTGLDSLLLGNKPLSDIPNVIHLEPEYIKATHLISRKLLNDLRAVAYYERTSAGALINNSIEEFLKKQPNLEQAKLLYAAKK